MKKKLILASCVALASLAMLTGCVKKNKNTSTDTGTTPKTTDVITTGVNPTTNTGTTPISTTEVKPLGKYEISEEDFNSVFKPSFDDIMGLNLTINKAINNVDEEQIEYYQIEFDNNKLLSTYSTGLYNGSTYFDISKEGEKLKTTYYEYDPDEGLSSKFFSYDLNEFYDEFLFGSLDYSKITYDDSTKSYSYGEEIIIKCEDKDFKYTNLTLKFVDSMLFEMFGNSIVEYLDDQGEVAASYAYEVNYEISKVGETTVKNPYSYTLAVSSTDGGSVTGADTDHYMIGSSVLLKATPDDGYEFVGWFFPGSDTPFETDSEYEALMMEDVTLEARFEEKTTYTLTIVGPIEGTIVYDIPMSNPITTLPSREEIFLNFNFDKYTTARYLYNADDDWDYSFGEEIELFGDLTLEVIANNEWYVRYSKDEAGTDYYVADLLELSDDYSYSFLSEAEAYEIGYGEIQDKEITGWKIIGVADTYNVGSTLSSEALLEIFDMYDTIYMYPVYNTIKIKVNYVSYDSINVRRYREYSTSLTYDINSSFLTLAYTSFVSRAGTGTGTDRKLIGWGTTPLVIKDSTMYYEGTTYTLNSDNFEIVNREITLYAVLTNNSANTTISIDYYTPDGSTLVYTEDNMGHGCLLGTPVLAYHSSTNIPSGKKLIGWSLTKNSETADVLVGQSYYIYPAKMTLYAVYGDQ